MGDWIHEIWCIHSKESYSVIKRKNVFVTCSNMDIRLSEKSQSPNNTYNVELPFKLSLKNNQSLKLNIQKNEIMASSPITSWQIGGETREPVTHFIFLGSKTTADGDCDHEIKRCLLLGRKTMTNLDSISKSRDITLPTKVHLVKAMVFLVVMYRCES